MKKIALFVFTLFLVPVSMHAQWQQHFGPFGINTNAIVEFNNNLYAATDRGVYISPVNSPVWTKSGNGIPVYEKAQKIVKTFYSLFCSTGSSLFRSNDNGATWEQVIIDSNLVGSIYDIKANMNNNTVFISTADSIYYSVNNGYTWQNIHSGLTSIGEYEIEIQGTVVYAALRNALTNNIQIYKYNIGQSSFIPIITNLNTPVGINHFRTKNDTLFFTSYNTLKDSTTLYQLNPAQNNNWVLADTTTRIKSKETFFNYFGDTLLIGVKYAGIYLKLPDSTNLKLINNGNKISLPNYIYKYGNNYYIATKTGIYRSPYIENCVDINKYLYINDVIDIFKMGNLWYSVSRENSMFDSDNLSSWFKIYNDTVNSCTINFCIHYSNTMLISTKNPNYVLKSTDKGISWHKIQTGLNNQEVLCLALNGNKLFAGTCFGLYVSDTLTLTWTPVSNGLPQYSQITSLYVSQNHIYAGIAGYGIYISDNNGISWASANTGLIDPTYDSYKFHEFKDKIYVSMFSYINSNVGLYSSDTAQISWNYLAPSTPFLLVNSFATYNNYLFTTTNNGIYVSYNNNNIWVNYTQNINTLNTNYIYINGTDLIAATNNGFYKRSLVGIGIEEFSYSGSMIVTSTQLSFSNIPKNTTATILSIDGKQISTMPLNNQNSININTLSPGIYLVRLVNPEGISTQKFLKR